MTNQVAGERAGICAAPIYVELAGPRCPELTLVDLPGIVKNPLPGSDQPADIEAKTLELVRLFGASPSAILLAVVPAIIDPVGCASARRAAGLRPAATGARARARAPRASAGAARLCASALARAPALRRRPRTRFARRARSTRRASARSAC